MKNELDQLMEWAVWGHLDSETDLELVLLKGHLLLELILGTILSRNNIPNYEDFSFHKKIIELEKINMNDNDKKDFIVSSLKEINKLRNKLAHEFEFEIDKGGLEIMASNILDNLRGRKFTKYTYRTKIVHSFSTISMNMLELTH